MRTHTKSTIFAIMGIMLLANTYRANAQQYPDSLDVPVIFYDFKADGTNPAFQSERLGRYPDCQVGQNVVTGMVQPGLDIQRKPIAAISPLPWDPKLSQLYTPNCWANMDRWFRYGRPPTSVKFDSITYKHHGQDFTVWSWTNNRSKPWDGLIFDPTPGIQAYKGPDFNPNDTFACYVIPDTLSFKLLPNSNGKYQFIYKKNEPQGSQGFFPIDNRGWGDEGNKADDNTNHNFGFSMEIHRTFTYTKGMTFSFEGDDDVWCFINNQIAIDCGGVHNSQFPGFLLDTMATKFGLTVGEKYAFDFFYCERHTSQSNIKIETNIITARPPDRLVLNVPSSQLPAGTIINISASLLDDTGAVVPKSSPYYNHITWQLLEAKDTAPAYSIYTPQPLKTTFAASNVLPGDAVWVGNASDKSTASVRSLKAHRVIKVQVTFMDTVNNKIIVAAASIFIVPNTKYKITLEKDTIPDLWVPDVYPQTTLTTAPFKGSVYAFHRDSLNNLYDLDQTNGQARSALWQVKDAGDTILVNLDPLTNADPNRQWVGVFIRNPIRTLGQARGWVIAQETGVPKTDSLEVVITDGVPDSIRIVRVDGTILTPHDSLTLTTDDVALLKVEVKLTTDLTQWWDWPATWTLGQTGNPTIDPVLPTGLSPNITFSPTEPTDPNAKLIATVGSLRDTLKLKVTIADPSFVALRLLSSTSDTPYIAGKLFRVIAEIQNKDGLVPGTWCASNPRSEAIYQDVLFPSSVKGNSATVASTEETGGINRRTGSNNSAEETEHISECFHNGLDTVNVTIYNANDNHILWLLLNGKDGKRLEAFTLPFNVLPGALSSITILDESHQPFPPQGTTITASDSSNALILRVRGVDAYGNIIGDNVVSNWDTASNGNLHLPDPHLNQTLFNYTTNTVKVDETGCLIAVASSNASIKDTVCLSIDAPKISYTAITRDGNGNGLLDTIALTFSAPVSLSDADISNFTLGNGLTISHIVPKSTNLGETEYYLVLTTNDTTKRTTSTLPQTNMTPTITLRNSSEISTDPVTPVDGAGPVVWEVKEYISGNTAEVHVKFSETVAQISGSWNVTSSIKTMFDVYQYDNPSQLIDTALNTAKYVTARGDSLVFSIQDAEKYKLQEFQNLKIHLIDTSSSFRDQQIVGVPKSGSFRTLPIANNIGPRVLVIYDNIRVTQGPNPFPPAPNRPNEPKLLPHNSRKLGLEIINNGIGGTIFEIKISPRNGPGDIPLTVKTLKATFNVYDVIGNLVYNRTNEDLTNTPTWKTEILDSIQPSKPDWTSGDPRTFAFYWNGFNDRKMACAPGVYRAMIFITIIATDKETGNEYTQRLAPVTKVCGIRR